MEKLTFYKWSILSLCLLFAGISTAQKLPNIQVSNQWLPEAVKIDGKLTEWNGFLSAYNKATLVEYTLANNDKDLYLAIRSNDKTTTAKILAGGISFILNSSGNERYIITFPATNPGYTYDQATGTVTRNYTPLTDSADINKAILQLTDIKVSGFKKISDSLISFYNEYGIKAKLIYSKETLVGELSIPLNIIGLSQKLSTPFTYNVRINGVPVPKFPGAPAPPPGIPPPGRDPGPYLISQEIGLVTDFSGKYALSNSR